MHLGKTQPKAAEFDLLLLKWNFYLECEHKVLPNASTLGKCKRPVFWLPAWYCDCLAALSIFFLAFFFKRLVLWLPGGLIFFSFIFLRQPVLWLSGRLEYIFSCFFFKTTSIATLKIWAGNPKATARIAGIPGKVKNPELKRVPSTWARLGSCHILQCRKFVNRYFNATTAWTPSLSEDIYCDFFLL